jgi:hypothetical protein
MRLPSRLGIGCASGARIHPFRAVIIHARELTVRGFTPELSVVLRRKWKSWRIAILGQFSPLAMWH